MVVVMCVCVYVCECVWGGRGTAGWWWWVEHRELSDAADNELPLKYNVL